MKKIWFFNHNWRSHNNNTYNKCKIDERETCVPGHRSVSVLEGCPGQGLLYPPLPLLVGVPEELLHLGPGSPPRLRQGRVLPLHLVRHCLLGEGLLHLGHISMSATELFKWTFTHEYFHFSLFIHFLLWVLRLQFCIVMHSKLIKYWRRYTKYNITIHVHAIIKINELHQLFT